MLYGLVCLVILARLHSFKLLLFFKTIVIKLIKMMALFVNLQGLNGVLLTPYSDRRFHLVCNQCVMNTVTFNSFMSAPGHVYNDDGLLYSLIAWGSFSSAQTL